MEEKEKEANKIQSKEVMFKKIKSIRNYLKTNKRHRKDILNINANSINDYDNNNNDKNNNINNNIQDGFVILDNDIEYDKEYIYIKYLEKPDIIFQNKGDINNNNLILLFNELKKDMEDGFNILFPFIDICPNLIKAYIESDLDDINFENEAIPSISDSTYIKTIIQLKNNFFINKEILFPIYNYFSDLYDIVNNLNENEDDIKFKKLNKVIKLFEIFYDTKEIQHKNDSSFCFIGGRMDIIFNSDINMLNSKIFININILNCDFIQFLNSNKYLIKIDQDIIKYQDLKNNANNQILKSIKIIIQKESIDAHFILEGKEITISQKNKKIIKVKKISLLEEFYGQITSIELSIGKNENELSYQYLFNPISIRDENYIYFYKKILYTNNKEIKIDNPKIIINNKNLVNINYINFTDYHFDKIEYFGGIVHFLPFYKILKNLSRFIINKNDFNNINENESINKTLNSKYENIFKKTINHFFNFILKVIIKVLFYKYNAKKLIEKYAYFVYILILDINLDISISINLFEKEKEFKDIYNCIDMLLMLYHNQKNQYFNNIKNETEDFLSKSKIDPADFNFLKPPAKSLNQMYKQTMKKLFCFNNYWSKKNVFYPKRYKGEKSKIIKYKQINYYTKNFQFPYLYPILEFSNYNPDFSSFIGELFKDNERGKILEYDFKLEIDKKPKDLLNVLVPNNSEKSNIFEKCCLVKNTHHVSGKLFLIKKGNTNNNSKFKIIFECPKTKESERCNKTIEIKKEDIRETKIRITNDFDFELMKNFESSIEKANIKNLCYGSTFKCPDREYDRNIIIKSKNILFVLIRNYYHRVSGLEIFTLDKSYYFNFKNQFEINNIKTNKILNEIKNNAFFSEIKMKKEKIVIGYYNIKYKPYLFPLFEDEINYWSKKINYYCNYDILTLINIFSNRSFRDVFQYPIFPTLYKLINKNREMDEHIGFQTITQECLKRKNLFLKDYLSGKEDNEEELFLFNIHYSNPAFLFNYLLRIFPYSFMAIEFQGDNFDDPNRLFHSIENSLKSTLALKSDLREMIPELYYMLDLFYNKNNLLLGKLIDGRDIDNVDIKENEKIEEGERMDNYSKYLENMRKWLEQEKELNKWIDLIFGIKQTIFTLEKDKSYNYHYYEKNSEIVFKNDTNILEDKIEMDKVNFGLLPYQLFTKEFPIKNKMESAVMENLVKLNKKLFEEEHIKMNCPTQTFMCIGRLLINNNYLKIIDLYKLNKLDVYFDIHIPSNMNLHLLNNQVFNCIFSNLDIEKKNNNNLTGLINNYFIGNIFGTILIYKMKKMKIEEETKQSEKFVENENKEEQNEEQKEEEDDYLKKENSFEIIPDDYKLIEGIKLLQKNKDNKKEEYLNRSSFGANSKIFQLEVKLIKKLHDHTKEIKYIDFNERLNILLTYSLDNYINIYIFPKLKLINTIDTNSFRVSDDNDFLDKAVLISFPFPSIICHNKKYIYQLSINGELIKYKKLEEGDIVSFSIDKNLGLVEDKVEIYDFKKEYKNTFNINNKEVPEDFLIL